MRNGCAGVAMSLLAKKTYAWRLRFFSMTLLVWLGGWALPGTGMASIQMLMQIDRSQYVLYEPVTVKLTLGNNTGRVLNFTNPPDGTWLDFLVTRLDGAPVRPDQKHVFAPLTLRPDETKAMAINITPLCAFRETGQFRVQATIDVDGEQYLSPPVQFTIVNGDKIWSYDRKVGETTRAYSLIRFSPEPETMWLYIRVEDAEKNVVYAMQLLGDVVAFSDPQTGFDPEGRLHLLNGCGKRFYRYSRIAADGHIETQVTYGSSLTQRPQLTKDKDGSYFVIGGYVNNKENRRDLLSKGQALLNKEAPEKTAPASAEAEKAKQGNTPK